MPDPTPFSPFVAKDTGARISTCAIWLRRWPFQDSVGIHASRSGTVHEQIRVQRKVEVRRRRRIDSEEFRRRNADHREGHIIDENRLSNRTRRPPKALLAGRKADDRDRRCAWTVVFGVDQTS